MTALSRRRFLAVTASAAVLGPGAAASPPQRAIWTGTAMGARAAIWFDGVSDNQNAALIATVRAEIDRLENLFSLYRADSAISRLNRTGRLARPDPDILQVLALARSIHHATGGAFDPTVQPVWDRLARRYADGRTGKARPDDAGRAAAGPPVDFDLVRFDAAAVTFGRPGMALTLNGIAQGHITDRVVALLKRAGLVDILVEAGEFRALGGRSDGSAWPVRLRGRRGRGDPGVVAYLDDMALATSDTAGTSFDAAGRISHIIDPDRRRPTGRHAAVSVTAPSAAVADGLSTAFCLMGRNRMDAAAAGFAGARVVHTAGA